MMIKRLFRKRSTSNKQEMIPPPPISLRGAPTVPKPIPILPSSQGSNDIEHFVIPPTPTFSSSRTPVQSRCLSKFTTLDDDSVHNVFSFLDAKTLGFSLPLVSKWCKEKADSDYLWMVICRRRNWGDKQPYSVSFKEVYLGVMKERVFDQAEVRYWRSIPIPPPPPCGLHYPYPPPPQPVPRIFQVNNKKALQHWPLHPNEVLTTNINALVIDLPADLTQRASFIFQMERVTLEPYSKLYQQDENYATNALRRYVRFLHLKQKYPTLMIVPTHDIVMVWISHLIRPDLYEKDCKSLGFNEPLEFPISLTHLEWTWKEEALLATHELWQKEYDEPYVTSNLLTREAIQKLKKTPFRYRCSMGNMTSVKKTEPYVIASSETYTISDFINPLSLTLSDVMKDRQWFTSFMQYLSLHSADYNNVRLEYFHCSENLPADFLAALTKKYERFLYLNAAYPEQSAGFHPTYSVDIMWHAHMLLPKQYKEDCLKYVGHVLAHRPWPTDQDLDNDYCMTKTLWQQEFQQDMESVHTPNCPTSVVKTPTDSSLRVPPPPRQ